MGIETYADAIAGLVKQAEIAAQRLEDMDLRMVAIGDRTRPTAPADALRRALRYVADLQSNGEG